jgi:hypothetical protein
MAENIETEIRKALDAKAHAVEVPEDLATRTLEMARQQEAPSWRGRLRAWRDSRRMHARVSGYPRAWYVAGAAATAALLFVLGSLVTMPRTHMTERAGAPVELKARSSNGETVQGGATGVVSEEDKAVASQAQSALTTEIAPEPPVPAPVPGGGNLPPKIVRTADIQVEVKHFDPAWATANSVAARYGGYVTNSNTEQVREHLGRGTVTMRVPAEKLDAALADLRRLGTLAQMTTNANDISAPIADVKARLKALQTEELTLLDLLRRASSLSQTLEIRDRLNATRQEIESLKAQRDVYENEVDYSTINATIFERGISPNDGDEGGSILAQAWRTALRIGLTIVAGTLVVLGGLVPLAALAIGVWLGVRAVRRRRTT